MGEKRLAVLLVLLIPLSGCGLYAEAGGSVGFPPESFNLSNGGLEVDGEVVNGGQTTPRYSNVTVYLFADDGRLLAKEEIGTLEQRTRVHVRADSVAEYIIVDSPEFWNRDISVTYYELADVSEGIYTARTVGSRSEFPIHIPSR